MCYPAKMNFRKRNRCNLYCICQCNELETQNHIFQECQPLLSKISAFHTANINDIYGDIQEQTNAIQIFTQIDIARKSLKESFLPRGVVGRTLADT